jgi:hypothetical protein
MNAKDRAQLKELIIKSEDPIGFCATVLQSLPNPRNLLRAIAEKHPGASEEQMRELFQAELELDPDMRMAVDVEVFQRLYAEETSEGRA